MGLLRKIIFYLFLIGYVFLCPLIIMYALGYIFSPSPAEGILKTGLVHIESTPAEAAISLGKRTLLKTTPLTIRDLRPGEYDLKIARKGFRAWKKKIQVEAGKAIVFDKLLMIPEQIKFRSLFSSEYRDLLPIEKTPFVLLAKDDTLGGLLVYDWKKQQLHAPFVAAPFYARLKWEKIYRQEKSSHVLIKTKEDNRDRYFWLAVHNNDELEIEDVTVLFARGEPDDIFWDEYDNHYLVSLSGPYLDRLQLEKMTSAPMEIPELRAYGLYDHKLHVIHADQIFRMSLGADERENLSEDKQLIANVFGAEKQIYRIEEVQNNLFVLTNKKGRLVTSRFPYEFVREGVRGFRFYETDESLLVWTENRIGVIPFKESFIRTVFFQSGPKIQWIYTEGKDISDAYWVYEGNYILFQEKDKVFLIAAKELYQQPPYEIANVKKGSHIYYTDNTGELYFLNKDTGRFSAAEIVPKETIFSMWQNRQKKKKGTKN